MTTATHPSAPASSTTRDPHRTADAARIEITTRLSANLRRCRERAGLTVAALAERSGVAARVIEAAEGARLRGDELGVDQMARLAEALGVDAVELVRAG